jgi:predicted RNase H-like HicB family nuclease
MATAYYVGYVTPHSGGHDVVFPDFPGCVSAGDTMQEAVRNAAESLALHVGGVIADGEPLPEPSPIDAPPPDWLADEDLSRAARVLVPVELPGKALRLNVSLEEALVARVDAAAATRGMSRSAFLAEGARLLLAREL